MSRRPVDLSTLPPVPTRYDVTGDALSAELRDLISHAAASAPRSQQRELGPSEIGVPCALRLGYRLAGVAPSNTSQSAQDKWRATIGTAVHAWLAETFAAANRDLDQARFLVEHRVHVGSIDGVDVDGSCDLLDRATGSVVDWKITSTSKIRKYRTSGPGEQYRVQAHAYGLGWANRGVHVERVAVAFLPRDDLLARTYLWTEPFDANVALQAISRVDAIARSLRLVDPAQVLRNLPRTSHYCPWCPWNDTGATDRAVACTGPA